MFNCDLQLARLVYDISEDEEVDPELVFRVIRTESRFVTDCVGKVGEIGLMQVRYGTALTIDRGATRKKLYDPALQYPDRNPPPQGPPAFLPW